jgi:hypothetical protein
MHSATSDFPQLAAIVTLTLLRMSSPTRARPAKRNIISAAYQCGSTQSIRAVENLFTIRIIDMTTYREGAQRVGATLDTLRPKVDQLERMSRETVAKIKEEDRRTQAEIKRLESKFVT